MRDGGAVWILGACADKGDEAGSWPTGTNTGEIVEASVVLAAGGDGEGGKTTLGDTFVAVGVAVAIVVGLLVDGRCCIETSAPAANNAGGIGPVGESNGV